MEKDRALFLYGFDVTNTNKYINFKNANLGNELTAVLNVGNYTCTEFMAEIKRAMELADGTYLYTVGLNRGVGGGSSNAMSILTSGSFLSILFLTGTQAGNSPFALMGWSGADYTGATSYTGITNAGTILFPSFPTWDYLSPNLMVKNDGVKNISASGIKETLVFAQMFFFQGQWQYITDFKGLGQETAWTTFLKYATKQKKFEFSPSVFESYDLVYQCTLESTNSDSNGLGYELRQMRGIGMYRFYDTGVLKFRVLPS